ncbi:ATP-NAD kinase [Nitrogeniibacter mangrovi]|uniref:ATP-NAD kinase n=1 Tax=Nitrogeniibacter mangrovi TaxID=2016596 RepID=A0A6C1B3N7_9RHOO|nr:NAD(+)/NADH kinase [Nitrogeniibacter mangrovi]QID16940.1 ATP-NAD kinase [Nitrogeniibacter mangrovi]
MPIASPREVIVGIVANPASGRDIRRLTAKASVFPTAEKANMVQRVLGPLGRLGVDRVLMMPDKTGISAGIVRALRTHHASRLPPWPQVEFLDMPITETQEDTVRAARMIEAAGAALVVVLGGDGTHRVVASACPTLPMATLSSGTNNVFPDLREATVVGLAAALFATGRITADEALRANKRLVVSCGGREEIALVDACVTRLDHIGARAVWEPSSITELFVTFAEPDAIGLSAIAAAVETVPRDGEHGLHVRCGEGGRPVLAPIAPGVLADMDIVEATRLEAGVSCPIAARHGSIALDGEREIELDGSEQAWIRLDHAGPPTLDVPAALAAARTRGVSQPFGLPQVVGSSARGDSHSVDPTINPKRRQS